MKAQSLIVVLMLSAMLMSCGEDGESKSVSYDYAHHSLPLVKREIVPSYSFPGMPHLSETAVRKLELLRAFFDHDFEKLDPAIYEFHRRYVDKESSEHPIRQFLRSLEDTKLAGVDACAAWTDAMPDSYAAHWICGFMWAQGAYQARSGSYASQVTPIRFALMRERLRQSNALLEKAITLTPVPIETMTMLAENHFMLGEKSKAMEYVQRALALRRDHAALHGVILTFALPEWGGSHEKVLDAMNAAREAGLSETTLMEYHDRYVMRPWELSNPGAPEAYWTKAIAEKPTSYRLQQLTWHYESVDNWRDMALTADQWVAQYPDEPDAYWQRASAHQQLGNTPQALEDFRMAAAHGSDWATQTLIRAYITGALGLPVKDWNSLDKVCRYGAVLGTPSAANCVASAYWEANTVDGPFKQDKAQALAWHQFAARGAYHNSQYDLGWLLLTGRVPGTEGRVAKEQGLFWLRRAAEQDHPFAKKKLQEGGYPESEEVGPAVSWLEQAAEILWRVLRFML